MIFFAFLAQTLRIAIPYLFAAAGGTLVGHATLRHAFPLPALLCVLLVLSPLGGRRGQRISTQHTARNESPETAGLTPGGRK